jgi:sugar (pentulose or hexulose) kinase
MRMSSSRCVLVVDFGAGSGKVFSAALSQDRIDVREHYRFPNHPLVMGGRLYNDIGHLYDEAKTGIIRAAVECGRAVASLGLDSWGNDYGLLDRRGELIGLPYNYRDRRTFGFDRLLDRSVFPTPRALYETTGIPFIRTTAYSQLLSHAAAMDPGEADRAATFLMTPDLVSYFLTGEKSCEYCETSTSGLVDARTRDWAGAVLATLPFDRAMFPPIVGPGFDVGPLRDPDLHLSALAETRLCKPVTHDTGSAVVSIPCPEEDFIYLSCGSWSLMGIESTLPVIDDLTFDWEYHHQGIPEGKIRVQKSIPGLWMLQQCMLEWRLAQPSLSFGEVEAMAARSRPFASYVNVYEPQFTLPGEMPAKIREFCRRTGQAVPEDIGGMTRCIYESVVLKYMSTARELDRIGGRRYEQIFLAGGGARDRLLASMLADATRRSVATGAHEASALGNALMQFVALGEMAGVGEARAVARRSVAVGRFEPGESERWEEFLARSRELDQVAPAAIPEMKKERAA